jgi:hypothetical protein
MIGENVNGLLVMASPLSYSDNASRLIELTLNHRLPAMFGYKEAPPCSRRTRAGY